MLPAPRVACGQDNDKNAADDGVQRAAEDECQASGFVGMIVIVHMDLILSNCF